jgi:hypothetical protein
LAAESNGVARADLARSRADRDASDGVVLGLESAASGGEKHANEYCTHRLGLRAKSGKSEEENYVKQGGRATVKPSAT